MGVIFAADMVEGGEAEQNREGKFADRTFIVNELGGSTASGMLLDAIATAGIPDYDDPHPDSSALRVQRIRAEPAGVKLGGSPAALVTVSYGPKRQHTFSASTANDNGPSTKQIRASLVSKQVTRDAAGAVILVSRPSTLQNDFEPATKTVEVEKLTPAFLLTFERLEETPASARARDFIGKTNLAAMGPYAEETLLCTRIDAVTRDAGLSYETTYEFIYDPEGHTVEVTYKLQNGEVPAYDPLVAGDDGAHPTITLYEAVSFTSLNLDFSD